MEKNELMKVWANKLIDNLNFPEDDPEVYGRKFTAIVDALNAIYEVGREAGRDEEKFQNQMNSLGKPHGIGD